ncbi:hypothetical protein SeLEV6574_g03191 [Synchytrium endobioticum]|nr:hypothetical protein SeLEV6574_g03191 [Synchytrium endobioticum]
MLGNKAASLLAASATARATTLRHAIAKTCAACNSKQASYASMPSQQPQPTIGGPRLPPHLIHATLRQPKLSQRGNPKDIKTQFLYALYTSILPKRVVMVLQLNAVNVAEYHLLNREFKKQGMNILKIRLGIFRAAVKGYSDRGTMSWVGDIRDPVSPDGGPPHTIESRAAGRKLAAMPVGHTAIVFADVSRETTHAAVLKDVNQVIHTVKPFPGKVMIVGAKVDSSVFSREELEHVATLPSLPALRGELVGLLQSPAAALLGHLSAMETMTGTSLVSALEARGSEIVSLLSRHSMNHEGRSSSNSEAS